MHRQPYTESFYKHHRGGARHSAERIVPLILQLVQVRSVIDVGCGLGTWLSVFREHGVEDVWGVEGEHIKVGMLEIPRERLVVHDLKQPLSLERTFDLVVSLEVGEHLPPECARPFVHSLTNLGMVVVFSAAIPFQGGSSHLNEQWLDYWAAIFQERGFVPIDCLRRHIWNNDSVDWWYAQNIILFARTDCLDDNVRLRWEFEHTHVSQLSLVHPRRYERVHPRSYWLHALKNNGVARHLGATLRLWERV
jgi:SAM-dependent methyltransferase